MKLRFMRSLTWVILVLLQCALVPALILNNDEYRPVKVLVFGDSWGSVGPSYRMIQMMFDSHSIPHEVRNVAVMGTTACHWAKKPFNMAVASFNQFNPTGPDFAWLSTGGNDLLNPEYLRCSRYAKSYEEALECAYKVADSARTCNIALLDELFKAFPQTKVVQCGYDFQCASGTCVPFKRWPYCKKNVSCANHMGVAWGHRLIDPLKEYYDNDRYTGIFVEGSCQVAGNFSNAAINNPVFERESPCKMMLACVHPIPGSAAAITIGEAFWQKYFAQRLQPLQINNNNFIPLTPIDPPPGLQYQQDIEAEDTFCNRNWYPDLSDPNMPPPPCNRTFQDFGFL